MLKIVAYIFFTCCTFSLYGQQSLIFHHYSTDDGLSHGSITSIIRDKKGFMWFATWDGINRFDGYEFKTFKATAWNRSPLSSNRIEYMHEDAYGCIWVITYDSRIYRFNILTEQFEDILNLNSSKNNIRINKIISSKTGDVWISSFDNGLYRVQIEKPTLNCLVTNYSMNGAEGAKIQGDTINTIFEDSRNNLWLVYKKGVSMLKRKPGSNEYVQDNSFLKNLNEIQISSVTTKADRIVFGTTSGDIINFNSTNENFQRIGIIDNINITNLLIDSKNRLYIALEGEGLLVYNLMTGKRLASFREPRLKNIYHLYEDSRGLIWIETDYAGVLQLNPDERKISSFQQKVDVTPVQHITSSCSFKESRNGVLWLTLKGGGFGYYNDKDNKIEYFHNNPQNVSAKMSNFVTAFYLDSTNVLWLSTYDKGIEKITFLNHKFNHIQIKKNAINGLSNEVRAIFEDTRNRLWLATKDGNIYTYDKSYQFLTNITEKYQLVNCLVYSIIEDDKKNIWLGTKGYGLFCLQYINSTDYKPVQFINEAGRETSLSDNNVYSVFEDNIQQIWVGTFNGGLNLMTNTNNGGEFINKENLYQHYFPNRYNRVRFISQDNQSNLWIATTNGLIFFDPRKIKNEKIVPRYFNKKPQNEYSLGNNDVYCIHNDNTGKLWFGTLGGGLNQLIRYPDDNNEAEFEKYTKQRGLASDVIFSIESDLYNNLWMSTESGLIKYDQRKDVFHNYNEFDGLNNVNFSEATSCLRENGDICFGAYDGLYFFSPDNLTEQTKETNLELTGFQLHNQEQSPGEENSPITNSISNTSEVVLDYNQNIFNITYTSLNFSTGDKINYKYKLVGYEDKWHHVGNRRIATYTKVPPGDYRFILSIDNPDIKIQKPRTLDIKIKNPLWLTPWAFIVYVILFVLLIEFARRTVITFFRLRKNVAVEKQMSEVKLKFFTNISHELRTPITLIKGPLQEISKNEQLSDRGKYYLKIIETNTKRVLQLLGEILDFRKVQNNSLQLFLSKVEISGFIRSISENYFALANEKGINFSVDELSMQQYLWLDENRINSVINNLLLNSFKYTSSGRSINLKVLDSDKFITIIIKDQGVGIPLVKQEVVFKRFANIGNQKVDEGGTGIGLSLSKEFVDLHGGQIFFESEEGKGSTFTVQLKKGKSHFKDDMVSYKSVSEEQFPDAIFKAEQVEIESSVDLETKILIVEDNSELREFIAKLCENKFTVVQAEDGNEGYEKAMSEYPDIIVSDIMMPGMDGLELLDRIKNNFETSHIPIILLTAKSSIENRIEGLKYGADAYITKPFNSVHLFVQIENLLMQRAKLATRYTENQVESEEDINEPMLTDRDNQFLQKVVDAIEENMGNYQFKITDLSEQVGLGRTNFFNKMKGLTGMSPVDFVKEIKLKKAVELLQKGEYNISEISYIIGFNDPGYFSRCFREKYKMSPSSYLKKLDNNIKK